MRVEREVKQPILAVPPRAHVSTKPPADQERWPRLPSSCSLSLQVMGGMAEQANNITPTSWSAASRGPCTTFLHANKCLESNSLQPKQGGWNPFNLLGKARHKADCTGIWTFSWISNYKKSWVEMQTLDSVLNSEARLWTSAVAAFLSHILRRRSAVSKITRMATTYVSQLKVGRRSPTIYFKTEEGIA